MILTSSLSLESKRTSMPSRRLFSCDKMLLSPTVLSATSLLTKAFMSAFWLSNYWAMCSLIRFLFDSIRLKTSWNLMFFIFLSSSISCKRSDLSAIPRFSKASLRVWSERDPAWSLRGTSCCGLNYAKSYFTLFSVSKDLAASKRLKSE